MASSNQDVAIGGGLRQTYTVAGVLVVLVLIGVGVASSYALLTVILDGVAAGLMLVPAMLAGAWLVPIFGFRRLPLRWHFLIGAAFGLGLLSLLVLVLGMAGNLDRMLWIGLLITFMVFGLVRWWLLLNRSEDREEEPQIEPITLAGWRWLWLLAVPFAVLALLAASTAPGFIWSEEGFGYDILEYHLQMPKEYYQAGQIGYAPHNVYANLPANVEMLYLLAMIVLDDVRDVGTVANMIHLAFAVLTVFAAWVIGREWSRRAGVLCGVVAATAGWLVYLSGLAYVENAMLFWGMVAAAVVLRFIVQGEAAGEPGDRRDEAARISHVGAALLAGTVAGFACGCKYTAVPLIVGPLFVITFFFQVRSLKGRVVDACLFLAGVAVTFSPWLIKNQVMTGNPVFPLANSLFQASPEGWGQEESERWDRGHRVQADERTLGARLGLLGNHVVLDKYQRFGPAIFLLALGGLLGRRRSGVDFALLFVLLAQLAIWLFATHLFARFAVVLLIPLVLLAGRSCVGRAQPVRQAVIIVCLVGGGIMNAAFAVQLQRQEGALNHPASLIYDGRLPGYEYFRAVNQELPADARVLLVGDAKAFYFQRDVDYWVAFNRSPFLELAREAGNADEVVAWLGERGYTHVLVNWSELRRLSATYGLSPSVGLERLVLLFEQVQLAGVRRVHAFHLPDSQARYVELYELPN